MVARKRREYSDKQREAVLADVIRLGVWEAASKHGVPESCVSRWAKASGVRRGQVQAVDEGKADEALAKQETEKPTSTADTEEAPAASKTNKPEMAAPALGASPKPGRRTIRSRVVKLHTPSQKAEILEYAAEHGVAPAATKFGVSRFSIYGWHRKVERAATGEAPSPTSGPAPADIEAQRDREILAEWHRHPGLGPSQIVNQLRRIGIKVSVNTARRVMEDAGYRPPKVKREPHDERYEAVRPNHLWHLDFVHRHINRSSTSGVRHCARRQAALQRRIPSLCP
jgi:transposase